MGGRAGGRRLDTSLYRSFTRDPNDITTEANHGEGIYLADADTSTGALSNVRLVAKTLLPSWIILSPNGRVLYSVNEISTYGDRHTGTISAYEIDTGSGNLTPLNAVDAEGALPTYLSFDSSGRFILAADYVGGAFAAFPIIADGKLSPASDVFRPHGPQMPSIAEDSPPGNFVRSDHRGPRGHMIHPDPSGKFLIADDAGLDQIYALHLDASSGKFSPVSIFQSLPGSAPRHFVFSPDGNRLYQIQEQDSVLSVYDFDEQSGTLTLKQHVSALPPGFSGTSASSEILISEDGRFLYSANRVHDSITTFSIAPDGKVRWLGTEATQGDWPRSLAIDSSGRFLYAMNQKGDNVVTFRIDSSTGLPNPTENFVPVPSAASMVFFK